MRHLKFFSAGFIVLVTAYADSDQAGRVLVSNSVRLAPATTISRAVLTEEELAATQDVQIQLGLRNVSELKERIVKGEIISADEMRARFYPTHEIWAAVATWVMAQGLAVDPEGPVRMSVVAHGHRDHIASAFQTKFARVIDRVGHEQISAVALPSVPSEIGEYVSGIDGLDPQLPPRTFTIYQPVATLSFGPQYLLDHYGASGVGDGTGR